MNFVMKQALGGKFDLLLSILALGIIIRVVGLLMMMLLPGGVVFFLL